MALPSASLMLSSHVQARLRLLGMAGVAVCLLGVTGCGCVGTPGRVKPRDPIQKQIEEEAARQSAADRAKASPEAGSSVFDTSQRMASLREYFELKRWDAVRHEGLALETAEMDEFVKLELLMMLTDAFAESGDRERAAEYGGRFRILYGQLRDGGRFAKLGKERESLLSMVGRVKAKALADLFVEPDGDQRSGVKLARRLREARPDDVLEQSLPDGGQVYFSKKPEALATRLESVDRELSQAICRDPEFDYYYAIKEPPRDTAGRPGR